MRVFPRAMISTAIALLYANAALADTAAQQSVTNYDLTIAGVSIGDAVMSVDHPGADDYKVSMDLAFRFLFWSGEASGVSKGRAGDEMPVPSSYNVTFKGMSEPVVITTEFDDEGPIKWSIAPPPEEKYLKERVLLTKADMKGAIDPISAVVIRAPSAAEACTRTLRVFSGATRLDLVLTPGAEATPGIYECGVQYVPVSGHRKDSESVARLVKNGPALSIFEAAPGIWVPHRVGLPTSVGTLAITRIAPEAVN